MERSVQKFMRTKRSSTLTGSDSRRSGPAPLCLRACPDAGFRSPRWFLQRSPLRLPLSFEVRSCVRLKPTVAAETRNFVERLEFERFHIVKWAVGASHGEARR